jgi:transposase InsO family protein
VSKVRADESALRTDVVRLAGRFGRYGYRQITNLLRIEGWQVNHKRVERIWRQEGLKVPRRQPKRGRLWLNDGSCIRLRPLHRNHVWSYDFVSSRTHDGRALKLLTVLDEHTRQCMAIKVARTIRAHDVLEVLADLFIRHGPPEHLRSDNGPEFTAKLVRGWLARLGVQTLYIEPGNIGSGTAPGGTSPLGVVVEGAYADLLLVDVYPPPRRPSNRRLGSFGSPSSRDRRWLQV